ncbi:hypothetical protein L486_02224 [Kwoniella mangroviensis CBS 10435]|uniref:GIT Spa2 homology (SHD) domain-containing protein n=1 Tax=Kwoniella mangroviensis CBS 10435 TaxID=1331196 RepID=A0A1B9IVK6_9TREE|nr:hypothetical protein L486_02224 [Kwoniella mangroviensis CBS 10435]
MASRFGQPSYSTSPPRTTASSIGYSQYGQSAFGGAPSRQPSTSSSGYQPQARVGNGTTSRSMTGGSASGGLRPPGGGGGGGSSDRKAESREIARVHWKALKEFLATWIEKESPTSRASAREKLTRLTKLQFQELSTDVYDELMRRIALMMDFLIAVPFLPVREDFHPKRNQARQKLATLPKNRFKDLASDVFYELKRRYPEFEEDVMFVQERRYDEPPPAPGPTRPPFSHQHSSSQSLRDRTNPTPPPGALNARLVSSGSQHQRQGSRGMSQGSHRSRPSRDQDTEILDEGRSRGPQANPMGTTSDVVVPNKSRLREEEIEVPYARDSQMTDQRRSRTSSRPASRSSAGRESRTSFNDDNNDREREREKTPRQENELMSPASADDRVYYDRLSFSSNVTNKSKLVAAQNGWDEEKEQKLRAEYEFRIAGLDRKVVNAERERDEARRAETSERERRLEWEEEVRGLKERAATHASSLRSLQHELDLAKDAVEAAKQRADQASRTAEEEIAQWRDRYDSLEDEYRRLEDEKANMEGNTGGPEAVVELKMELHTLVDELNALSMKNDELMSEREQDAMGVHEMEAKVEEYKRKYDAVRIELRNLKATSTMFVSKPLTDDHLPASADGNIADTSVSAFQTAIDGLLQAARSSQPSGVLPAMKAIVEAITEIGEDVKAFEAHPNLDVDVSRLESLKYESTNRLNALMQAARNHAMASGLSPVSLLDAAAGHLSTNVVEIIKLLKIRRSGQNREMSRRRSSMSIKDMVNRDQREKELKAVNGSWDREYGSQDRLSEQARSSPVQNPPVMVRRPSSDQASLRTGTPTDQRLNGNHPAPSSLSAGTDRPAALRINSFQSTSSMARSDSFDLERKSSMMSDRNGNPAGQGHGQRTLVEARSGSGFGMNPKTGGGRESMNSQQTQSSGGQQGGFAREQSVEEINEVEEPQQYHDDGVDDAREWEDLKPYLNTQSSALVNAIQNLLAAIRTNSSPSALNEHLSEVIAIASSIVAVSTNALPNSLRGEGDSLLKDLVSNTNKLSEAQESASATSTTGNGGAGGFEKTVRQQIASASFGVAKSLKALMKLGGAE